MPHSMTGFASAGAVCAPFRLVWEMRSVNHRFLDVSIRLPEELRPLEPRCRDLVARTLRRGKVDCTLKIAVAEESLETHAVASEALDELRKLQDRVRDVFPDARALSTHEVLRWPGVLKEPRLEFATLAEPAENALRETIAALQTAREREGERIAALLEQRNEAIMALLHAVKPHLDGAAARYRQKLEERLARFDVQAQPERLEQELVLLAQRLDVSEEVDRLTGHVTEVRHVLERNDAIGRRLDFLVQEMNREANTLGSKAQDEELTRTAVELKVLIEQMREQLQNLE